MKNVSDKIEALRAVMEEEGLDGVIVPKADEYQGEFVAPYAERLKWLTGFTGSAGVAVVLADKACVLTDGRYSLQVVAEVDGDVFETADSVKIGAHGWLKDYADEGAVIGFDPWLHTPEQIDKICENAPGIELRPVEENLIDRIWNDQPAVPCAPAFGFSEEVAGHTRAEKRRQVAARIREAGAQAAVITLPDSLAWLLNVRGRDISYIPSVLSYALIYADKEKPIDWITGERDFEANEGVKSATLEALHDLKGVSVMLDESRSPLWFKTALENGGAKVINAKDPCIDLKAIKTPEEYEAIKRAHVLDGIAVTKLLYWLDQAEGITELDAAAKIHELRGLHPAYQGPSFPTIAGFGSNGAIVHYRSSEATNKVLEEGSLFLIDSGGQYYGVAQGIAGTTDITRTVAIGTPSEEMRKHFTLVLKGHIALASARFDAQTTGKDIDALARGPLQAEGLNYAHGTGHGVGCYLAVHEEATSISPRGKDVLKLGMLISNEPGYYEEGAYGIRTENLVFVRELDSGMLGFETVSLAPIDRRLIVTEMLDGAERTWLNEYHARVYEAFAGDLSPEEAAWLKVQTSPL